MTHDAELLRRFAEESDQAAFADLVRRHIGFVHAAAQRQCHGNASLADEVAQQVFIDASRRAARLAGHPAFVAWLHSATRFAAMNLLRTEARRIARETRAAVENTAIADDSPLEWERVRPVIDEVLAALKERERAALLLRFFQGRSLAEVGAELQLSETAARSCVDRALEKMRVLLARRGLTSTGAALSVTLASQPLSAVPPTLAASITAAALQPAATTSTTLSLLLMKKAVLATSGLLLVAELTVSVGELRAHRQLQHEFQHLAPTTLARTDRASAGTESSAAGTTPSVSPTPATDELVALQRRIAQLKARPSEVTSTSLRPAVNLGQATPEAAMSTLAWATRTGNLDALAQFMAFSDDTPENRATFMANFSDSVRARYATPEQLLVAVNFSESLRDPPVAQQITKSQGFASGVHVVSAWTRYASGREAASSLPFQETAQGWKLTPVALTGDPSPVAWLQSRIDPATGAILPPRK